MHPDWCLLINIYIPVMATMKTYIDQFEETTFLQYWGFQSMNVAFLSIYLGVLYLSNVS